jgi:hypothetical protein
VKVEEGAAVLGRKGVRVGSGSSEGVFCTGAAEIGCGRIGAHPAEMSKIKIVIPRKAFMIVFILGHYNMEKCWKCMVYSLRLKVIEV